MFSRGSKKAFCSSTRWQQSILAPWAIQSTGAHGIGVFVVEKDVAWGFRKALMGR